MAFAFIVLGALLIGIVLWDVFETILLPRRVTRRFRLTRVFYGTTWMFYSRLVLAGFHPKKRETLLSYYGPLSLIMLLTIWAAGIIAGFAVILWQTGSVLHTSGSTAPGFGTFFYLSGTTFFTLGLGDVTPVSSLARALTVLESGLGLGLLALVIGYLPSLNQSFSRRETNISLLDARAGSPPSAAAMFRRQCKGGELDALLDHLVEWERWSAELLESHLSYPVLAYFRSQHTNQSWIGALAAVLDTSSLAMAATGGSCARQAMLTFAIARHALVDLSYVFFCTPDSAAPDRLSPAEWSRLIASLETSGIDVGKGPDAQQSISAMRVLYEPYLYSLSRYFCVTLPPWNSDPSAKDNWQMSAWDTGAGFDIGTGGKAGRDHF